MVVRIFLLIGFTSNWSDRRENSKYSNMRPRRGFIDSVRNDVVSKGFYWNEERIG